MITDVQKWLLLTGLFLIGWLLYLLSPVLAPFLVGALLAYLGDPLVDRLEKLKISRTISVIIVFACMLIVGLMFLLILIPIIESQLSSLVIRLPQFITWYRMQRCQKLLDG